MKSQIIVAAFLCTISTGCGVFGGGGAEATEPSFQSQPAPSGETAAAPQQSEPMPAGETTLSDGRLASRDVQITGVTDLPAGHYQGDLVLDEAKTVLTGAGADETVVDGDLYVASQCRVQGLTVNGNIVFTGNGATTTVVCTGEVLDYGIGNRH